MLRHASLCSVSLLILGIGGCPKRQGPSRIVYVPAAAPQATEQPAETGQVLVIEEPAPIEAEANVPPPQAKPEDQTAAAKPNKRPAHVGAGTAAPGGDTPAEDAVAPPQAEVPPLEPRESTQQAEELRQQIQRSLAQIAQRIGQIDEGKLSADDRKTLDDARTFYTASARALEGDDLQRALNLARKASLLVAALE